MRTLCLTLLLGLCGCVTYVGPDSRSMLNAETAANILPQKTTKADVIRMLGAPDEIIENGRRFVYIRRYEVSAIVPRRLGDNSGTPARYLLKVGFDDRDVVSSRDFIAPYEFQDKPVQGVPPYTRPPLYR